MIIFMEAAGVVGLFMAILFVWIRYAPDRKKLKEQAEKIVQLEKQVRDMRAHKDCQIGELKGKIQRYERLKNSKADAYRCAANHWQEKCISIESKILVYSDYINRVTGLETDRIKAFMDTREGKSDD